MPVVVVATVKLAMVLEMPVEVEVVAVESQQLVLEMVAGVVEGVAVAADMPQSMADFAGKAMVKVQEEEGEVVVMLECQTEGKEED